MECTFLRKVDNWLVISSFHFINSVNQFTKYLLSTYRVTGTVLGDGHTSVNKTDENSGLQVLYFTGVKVHIVVVIT